MLHLNIIPLRFNNSRYDWDIIEMHLMDHPYYSQMIYDLPEEIKKTFTKELPDVRGMDVMKSLAEET